MRIKCFGIAKDITNTDNITIEDNSSPKTVSELKQWIAQNYPKFGNIKTCMIAVNQEYANDTTQITSHDEIAIIPPVSGG